MAFPDTEMAFRTRGKVLPDKGDAFPGQGLGVPDEQ
jgi:hypothetical protein